MDWRRVTFTTHMTEAAAVVGEATVVFAFEPDPPVTFEVRVFQVLKGTGAPYFATGRTSAVPDGFRAFGEGESPEDAVEACLADAGVHLRRRQRQG
jgi:hypothetical protein